MISKSVLDTIGNTPLVQLSRLCSGRNGTILAKLENVNPGMSKKDRIAKHILERARSNGVLKPGQTVLELTSGNTGTGLAIACSVLGHPFIAVISEGNSNERVKMMEAFGAKVVQVPQVSNSTKNQVTGADLKLVEEVAKQLCQDLGAFRVDQFTRSWNSEAHCVGTADEIIKQTNAGQFDAFVDFVGTGGTYAGCMSAFKKNNPSVKGYIVEPRNASVLSSMFMKDKVQPYLNAKHKIQGGGYSMRDLPLLDASFFETHVDGYIGVSDEQAIEATRLLARQEGILGGFSSGANIAAALSLIDKGEAECVVVIVCDSGMKYLSTDLWGCNHSDR